eukprot:scaffold77605_cov18-Tisochrysis_lutea.AAC.1
MAPAFVPISGWVRLFGGDGRKATERFTSCLEQRVGGCLEKGDSPGKWPAFGAVFPSAVGSCGLCQRVSCTQGSSAQSTQLALERHWQQQQEQVSPSALTLPDVTLSGGLARMRCSFLPDVMLPYSTPYWSILMSCAAAGPLELVLQEAGLVSFFVPHAADVGVLRRVRLGPGVTVKVAGLKSITLRWVAHARNQDAGVNWGPGHSARGRHEEHRS